MSGKYEPHIKQLPISGRCGNIRLGAVMDGAFFGWDSFSVRYGLVDACGMIPEETDKQHTHEYDQMLWFIPADPDDMLTLGAELEISLGDRIGLMMTRGVTFVTGAFVAPSPVADLATGRCIEWSVLARTLFENALVLPAAFLFLSALLIRRRPVA